MSALLALFALLAALSPDGPYDVLADHVASVHAHDAAAEVEAPVEHTHLPAAAAVVAACESGEIRADGTPVVGTYSLTAEHPVSSASGKYQAISSTWTWITGLEPPASAYPEAVQDEFFIALWDGGAGASHWRESWGCMGWEGRP